MSRTIAGSSCSSRRVTLIFTLIVLLSSPLLPAAGQAADAVGTLVFTRGPVSVESAAGEQRTVAKDDALLQGELVVTGDTGVAVIRLKDDSRMTLRPNSAFRVNHLNMDAGSDESEQSAVLNLLRGGLRLLTGLIGKINPAGYRLNTPIATIGIRGTEFDTRLCAADCVAEEQQLVGDEAAAKVKEGLYVKVDDGGVGVKNFASDDPLELDAGESGYVSDLYSLPVKLGYVPAFQGQDSIPSPGSLDLDDIQIPDVGVGAAVSGAGNAAATAAAVAAAAATTAAASAATSTAGASDDKDDIIDVSGTYELEVEYDKDVPSADRQWFFGADPDIEFTLEQTRDKVTGEFDGDYEGTVKGVIDDAIVTVDFVLEARGGNYKDGSGTWEVQDNGDLVGKFHIRDGAKGIIRGSWVLVKD